MDLKLVLDFLSDTIELLKIQLREGLGDKKQTEIATDAYSWLMSEIKTGKSKRVQFSKEPDLKPGKIYIFKYDAKYKKELDYWDKRPIVLVFGMYNGSNGKVAVGVNLSWYPPPARQFIVEKIRKMYKPLYEAEIKRKPNQAIDQKPINIDLYAIKTALDTFGFSFALRQYIPANIRTPKVCVCYEDWDKALKLDTPRIFPELQINKAGQNLRNIYESFKKYILWSKNNRAEIKKRRDEAKRKNKYRFNKN